MKKLVAIMMVVALVASLGAISFSAFADDVDAKSATQIVIGEGETVVRAADFEGFTAVTEVVLPASVETVEEGAFADAAGITSVKTAGDPAILAGVAAFANATVTEITEEEYQAIVAEYEAALAAASADAAPAAGGAAASAEPGQPHTYYFNRRMVWNEETSEYTAVEIQGWQDVRFDINGRFVYMHVEWVDAEGNHFIGEETQTYEVTDEGTVATWHYWNTDGVDESGSYLIPVPSTTEGEVAA